MELDWVADEGCSASAAGQVHQFLKASSDDTRCHVDLTNCRWIGVGVLTALTAFIYGQVASGRKIDVSVEGADASTYMSRMGLPALLESWDVPHPFRSVRKDVSLNEEVLVELAAFSQREDLEGLARMLRNRGIPDEVRRPLTEMLFETGNNVREHARVEQGFLAAQVTHDGKRLTLAVADAGIGFLETLKHRGAATDRDALKMALNGMSEHDQAGRGQGLLAVRAGLDALGGWGTMVSGMEVVSMHHTKLNPWTTRQLPFAGTIFEANLPIR